MARKNHNYEHTKKGFLGQMNGADLERFAYKAGPAQERCFEKGLFQGRTPNPPEQDFAGRNVAVETIHTTVVSG